MKFLFDLLPVILFFLSFKYGQSNTDQIKQLLDSLQFIPDFAREQTAIIFATLVVIIATTAQVIWVKMRHGKVDKMLWLSFFLIFTLGGLTIYLHNPNFVMWKPTLLYWAFATVLLASVFLRDKNLIESLLSDKICLPTVVWSRLNYLWIAFFIFAGALNLIIAYNFSQEFWVNFKLFGLMGIMLIFILLQGIYLSKYSEEFSKPNQSESK